MRRRRWQNLKYISFNLHQHLSRRAWVSTQNLSQRGRTHTHTTKRSELVLTEKIPAALLEGTTLPPEPLLAATVEVCLLVLATAFATYHAAAAE